MIVHNPTETLVTDYPIQDPQTGDVALWSIKPGETLDFPQHAGKYLVEVYAFLQRVVTKEQLSKEKEDEAKLNKGQHFSQVKIVEEKGLTNEIAQPPAPTAEQLKPQNPVLTPPELQPTLAGQVEGDAADQVQTEPPPIQSARPTEVPSTPSAGPVKAGTLICPDCNKPFQNRAALKTHYAHQHLTLPGIG